jgi:tetratricopeptide (TPR) repeat protein
MSVPLAFSFLLLILTMPIRGQESNPDSSLSPVVEASWAAAQQAQQQKDYATAEQEYRKVISLSPGFAEAYMNLGLVYELQSRRQEALAMFGRAVRLKPGLAGAQFFLGVEYCKLGDATRALPHLEAAVRARPDLPDAWSWLATAHEMLGQTPEEVKSLQAGLRSNPQSVDLLYLLGHSYEQLGKEAVDRIQQRSPNSTYVEQLLAENYATSGYPAVALLHLENALKDSPDRLGLHLEIGEVFLHAGNLKRAQEEMAAELRLNPHNLRARVRRGEVNLLNGDVAGAMADWSQAITVDPTRTEAILGVREFGLGDTAQEKLPPELRPRVEALRGQIESQTGPASRLALAFLDTQAGGAPIESISEKSVESAAGKPSHVCTAKQVQAWLAEDKLESVASCSSGVLSAPFSRQLRLGVAHALFETGRPDRALRVLDSLPPAKADFPEVLYGRARCYKKLALATYFRLFELNPDSYRAHEVLGDLYAARGEEGKAIEEYQRALEKRPTLPNLHYQIGHLQWKVYKVQEARREFQAELALNPNHTGALFDLGNTYLYERQPEKALQYLKRVNELDPQNPDIHQFLGMGYTQLGRYSQAESELKLAAATDKEGKIHYQLGRLYQALGKPAEARREFSISDELNRESHRKNEQRVQRVAAAEAVLKQP